MPSSSVIGLGVILAVSAVLTTVTASKVAYNGGPHSSSRKMTTFHYEDPSKFGEDCGDNRECLRSKCALLNVKSLIAEQASFKEVARKKVTRLLQKEGDGTEEKTMHCMGQGRAK